MKFAPGSGWRCRVLSINSLSREQFYSPLIGTPMNIAVDGDRVCVRTFDTAGKLKHIRKNPIVEVVPSTGRGKPTG
jgi:hypothetical protein